LQLLQLERFNRQDELEAFIRATAFWLRDGKPLSLDLLPQLWHETAELAIWATDLVSETMVKRVVRAARSPLAALYAVLLFPVLPILLFATRQRLRRYVTDRNQETMDLGASVARRIVAVGAGLLSAAVFPAYFFFASRFIATAGLPAAVGPVAAGIVEHFSYFLLMWFLSRSFFAGRSIAQVQLGMPAEAAQAIHRSLRMVLLAYLVMLMPWILFRQAPFDFETMPRLGYTGFEIVAAIAVMRLIRTQSPFMRYAFAETDNHLLKRHWRTINGIITLLMLSIIVLDMAGYRYGAANLSASFMKSLVTMIAILPLYAAARAMFTTIAAQRRWTEPPSEEAITARFAIEQRIRQAIRLAFILVAVWLLAGYWGVDVQALQTLDNVHLYTIRGGETEEFLTAADAVRFVLIVAVTLWALWAMPGIYEFAIFPRLKLDEGLKYAILTISRYAVFGVGVVMALSATHLDLGRLGWLMAAMGVGLGFGLQEIVSNFVSGIILLVERPIQVGDIVTVGTMSGTVKRINIRATTILNFDRQEVIVPNRSLITSEVTNWTRGDTINRLVIKIGAAYGTDVDLVSRVLQQIAASQPEVLSDPPPQIIFMAHGESSLDFEMRVFIPSPALLVPLRDRLNKAINHEFAEHNIEIPFPQRDLHIKSSDIKLPGLLAGGMGKTDVPADMPEVRRS
jgi:potassium efflux system protein